MLRQTASPVDLKFPLLKNMRIGIYRILSLVSMDSFTELLIHVNFVLIFLGITSLVFSIFYNLPITSKRLKLEQLIYKVIFNA